MKAEKITQYYNAILKDLRLTNTPLVFRKVPRLGACIVHDTKGKIYNIQIDVNKCPDVEYALLHEIAHKILIEKNNNYSHNKTFKNLERKLNEKYMYSKFSDLLWK